MGSGIFTNKKYYQDNLELMVFGVTSINGICAAFGSCKESGGNDVFSDVCVFWCGM